MSVSVPDRWVWLGLGTLLLLATKGISYALSDIIHLNTVPTPQDASGSLKDEKSEHSRPPELRTEALAAFLRSPNDAIKDCARDTLVSRFEVCPTRLKELERDCFSIDPSVRYRASLLLDMLELFHCIPSTPLARFYALIKHSISRDDGAGKTIRAAYTYALYATLVADKYRSDVPWKSLLSLSRLLTRNAHIPIKIIVVDEKRMTARRWTRWYRAQRCCVNLGGNIDKLDGSAEFQQAVRKLFRTGENRVNVEDVEMIQMRTFKPPEFTGGLVFLKGDMPDTSPEEIELGRRRRREAMVLHSGNGQVLDEEIISPVRSP